MATISRFRRCRGVSGGSAESRQQQLLEGDDRLGPRQLALESTVLDFECFTRGSISLGVGPRLRAPPATSGRKPQAVRQVLPDLLRDLGDPFLAIWDQLHGAHGPREAARHLAKVLGQLETHGRDGLVLTRGRHEARDMGLLLDHLPGDRRVR